MVAITKTTQASEHVAEKSANTWIRKLSAFSYCVTPKAPGGTKRRVTLVLLPGNQLHGICEHYYDRTPCPGNQFGNLCYSVWRVITHLEQKAKREERKAA
jgi:hypothetical protein